MPSFDDLFLPSPVGKKKAGRVSPTLEVLDLPVSVVESKEFGETEKKMVCLLVAIGEPVEMVAEKLGHSLEVVRAYVHSDAGMERVIKMQTALYPDPVARVKKSVHLAIDASLRLLLKGKNEAVVAKVAADIMDRSMGKAVQIHENRNFNVDVNDMEAADRALLAQQERLDRLEKTRALLAARQR
jgi:hypothetical protein